VSPRRPYANGIATREEILAIALDHFSRGGYDGTSVREVAREAGLSQAGLLYHFPTKEDLFLAVLRWRAGQDLPDRAEPVTVDRLVEALETNRDEPGLGRLYLLLLAEGAIVDGPLHEYFRDRYAAVIRGLEDDVRRAQEAGEVSASLDARTVASLLVAAADGLQVQALLDADGPDAAARLRQYWVQFSRGPAASRW
jgi:AcrR family transcriptional regulator